VPHTDDKLSIIKTFIGALLHSVAVAAGSTIRNSLPVISLSSVDCTEDLFCSGIISVFNAL